MCGEEALQIGMDWCAVGDTDKLVDFVELVYADKTRKGLLIVSEMDKLEVTPGNFGVNKCGGLGSCFELLLQNYGILGLIGGYMDVFEIIR